MNAPTRDLAWTGTEMISVTNPDPSQIHLRDIAVGLSRENRYGGSATSVPWNVVQHSRLCVHFAEEDGVDSPRDQLVLLMHDAPEYMLRDMISPVKSVCPDYKKLEAVWWIAVAQRFHLPLRMPKFVKKYDLLAASAEKKYLISPTAGEWPAYDLPAPRPVPPDILALTQSEAASWFLTTATRLLYECGHSAELDRGQF